MNVDPMAGNISVGLVGQDRIGYDMGYDMGYGIDEPEKVGVVSHFIPLTICHDTPKGQTPISINS